MWVQGVYLFCSLMFPSAQKNVQQSLNKDMLNYIWIWASQVTSYVFLFGSNSVGGLYVLLLLFLLHSMLWLAQNTLLLAHLSTSPYDHLVTGNIMSSSEIILKFTYFEMLPFMKYNCDSIFQLSLFQHEKFYMEKASQKTALTVYC